MAGSEGDDARRDKKSRDLHVALVHPLRRRILRLLSEDRESERDQIAADLGETPARVAYHLRTLVRHDAVRVVTGERQAPIRYRSSLEDPCARELLDEEEE
jgi:DNA-binding transcriptional ArsR family regulator